MKIEIFGLGCLRCQNTAENVKKALAELKQNADIVHITDIDEMIKKGIIRTPALAIDGKIVSQGKVPTKEEIRQFIQKGGE